MGTLKQKYARLRAFKNFDKVLNRIILDNKTEIIALNRDQMYEDGIVDVNRPSNILEYAPSTIKQKKRRARYKRTDHITLKWGGSFHEKMDLKVEAKQFTIISTDPKWAKFSSGEWGQRRFMNALGLTKNSLKEFRLLVRSDLILTYKDAVQNS